MFGIRRFPRYRSRVEDNITYCGAARSFRELFRRRECNRKERRRERSEARSGQVHGTSLFRPCEESARNSSDTRRRLAPSALLAMKILSSAESKHTLELVCTGVCCSPRDGTGTLSVRCLTKRRMWVGARAFRENLQRRKR